MRIFNFFSKKSGKIARDRLMNVLISDRAGCSAATLENIRNEMNHVLSKYAEIDTNHTDFKIMLKKGDDDHAAQPVLIAYIPFCHTENPAKHA